MTEDQKPVQTPAHLSTEERLAAIEERLDRGSDRMDRIERTLNENTDATLEVRDLINTVKGGFKVLGWLGGGAKWIGSLATAGAAIYGFIWAITHPGQLPK